MSSFLDPPCTNLANCLCKPCVQEREEAGVYEGKFSTEQVAATFADVTMASGEAFSANEKQGFLLVRTDGKASTKSFRKAFKKFYVVVAKELLSIKRGQNSNQSLIEINLANALLAFDRDKNGEFIRVANADDVLEMKPLTNSIDAMNEWKDCLQGLGSSDEPKHKSPTRGGMRASMYTPKAVGAQSSGKFLTDGALAKARGPQPSSPRRSPKKQGAVNEEKRKFMEIMVQKEVNEPLGMRICGGVGGDPHRPEIRVHSITAGSVATGLNLEEGDIIIHINHRKLDDVTVQAASKLLQKAYGLVAVGITRKIASQRGSVASIQLDTLPFADEDMVSTPLPPAEDTETFGFPPGVIAEDEEEGEHVEGFGGFGFGEEPATEAPREQRFGDPEVEEKPKEEAPAEKSNDEKFARAERLRKMKEARAKKKGNLEGDLVSILSWIDSLDENDC